MLQSNHALYFFFETALMLAQILEFVDDPRTFVRASQVSRRWREILGDDQAWKTLCEKHAYRRMSNDSIASTLNSPYLGGNSLCLDQYPRSSSPESALAGSSQHAGSQTAFVSIGDHVRKIKRPRPRCTHRLHFKHRYLVESAWKKGGRMTWRHVTSDQGVVTSLHLTKKYIVLALDNSKIHVFDVKGDHQRTLQGHAMGVWAIVPWGDMLVSGGCDRDVRVWNMATGYTFDGHNLVVSIKLTSFLVQACIHYEAIRLLFAASRCRIRVLQYPGLEILPCVSGIRQRENAQPS